MKKSFRRTLCIVFALMMVFCTALSASAAPAKPEDVAQPMYNGITEAFNATNISGGYGELQVYLSRNITGGAIKAAVSNNSSSGTISVTVKTPSGSYIGMSPMYSGGDTSFKYVGYLSAGTYIFYFEPAVMNTLNVQGYIYS